MAQREKGKCSPCIILINSRHLMSDVDGAGTGMLSANYTFLIQQYYLTVSFKSMENETISQNDVEIGMKVFDQIRYIKTTLLCAYILFLITPTSAQNNDSLSNGINRKKLRVVVITSGLTYGSSMIALNEVWYSQSSRSAFHFFNDLQEWKQMDKVGHIYSAFQLASISSQTFQWTGLSKARSDRLAAISSFGIMASIEVLDGFSSAYGASLTDLLANTSGIGIYYGQKLLWKDIRIHPKFSFHRTSFAPLVRHEACVL